jgi:hypothetical protein
MAIITTNTNLSSLTITAGEVLDIRNGATLTINSTPSVLPGNISCITSGKLRIENNSTTTPIRVPLLDMNRDFRFEGNGVMEVRGQMMEIGTGTGASQSFNFATLYSGVINDITYVEVETASGSGEYTPWGIVPIDPIYFNVGRTDGGGAISEFVGTPYAAGKVAFWHDTNKTLSFGDNTNGWSVPTGCKIRIPNILITNDYATDASLIHAIVSEGTPTGGTFTITIRNRKTGVTLGTTATIAFNATAATIDTAIEAITGLNTVTSAGGPLPTAVSITWAGTLASTPLALTVDSSALTGGTAPVIHTRENSAGNLTLIDLNPSGTLDAENCMFSQKIRFVNDAWSRIRLVGVGLGSDIYTFNNSNGNLTFDKVSFTVSPYTAGAGNAGLQNVLGQVSINKYVHTVRRSNATFIVSAVPNITKLDNCTQIIYFATARGSSGRATFNLATLSQNLVINNMVSVGGRIIGTNLFNTIWNNTKVADTIRNTQDITSTTNSIALVNCVNQTFLNTGMAGIGAPRNYFLSTDINSSNIEVINANLNGGNNSLSFLNPNGKNTKIKNSVVSNIRTGPFIDQPSTYTASGIEARKLFNTYATAQSTSGLDVAQDGVYDMLSSGIAGITEAFASVENYVGGNFADVSLTPTTGHITFGPVGRGNGYTPTGATYTSQTGFAAIPNINDTMELEIPFAMHGITDFQNVAPSVWFDGSRAITSNHTIINAGGITGGTFTITVRDASGTSLGTTPAQAWNSSAATIQTAIRALNASINLSTVSGALSSGFLISLIGSATLNGIVEVDGSLLTGGLEPNIAYAFGRCRLLAGEGFGTNTQVNFTLATASGSYGSHQTLTSANLISALAGLSGYNAGEGLKMKVKMTALTNDPYRALTQLSMPTNINPSLWVLTDSSIILRGLQPNDIAEIRKASDNSLLYTFTGSGTKDIDVGINYGTQAYFIRKNSGGIELMRTQATPFTFSIGNLGTFNLFAGAEVQLAESGTVTEIANTMALQATLIPVKTQTDKMQFNAENHIVSNVHQLQAGAINDIQDGLALEATSQEIKQDLEIINNGVKKASLLIPHAENL